MDLKYNLRREGKFKKKIQEISWIKKEEIKNLDCYTRRSFVIYRDPLVLCNFD